MSDDETGGETGRPGLRLAREGGVATVTLSREAKRNALDLGTWRALAETMDALSAEGDLRCVLLRGAGEVAFSAGADVSAFPAERGTEAAARAYDEAIEAAYRAVEGCAHPVVAAVSGWAMGGGCGLALAADLRVGGPGTRMGIPARDLGLFYPPSGLDALLRLAGHAVAAEMLLAGRVYDGAEAEARRLLTRLVPDESVQAEARALCGRVAEGAPLANRHHKCVLRALRGPLPPEATEREAQSAYLRSEDHREAVSAFRARRRPVFRGR